MLLCMTRGNIEERTSARIKQKNHEARIISSNNMQHAAGETCYTQCMVDTKAAEHPEQTNRHANAVYRYPCKYAHITNTPHSWLGRFR